MPADRDRIMSEVDRRILSGPFSDAIEDHRGNLIRFVAPAVIRPARGTQQRGPRQDESKSCDAVDAQGMRKVEGRD